MKRIWSSIQPALIMLIVLLSFGLPGKGLSDTPDTRVFVNPPTLEATTCALHTIAIRVEEVENLTGYHLEIDFDPAVVNVTKVENGGFLDGAEDEAFYEPTNEIDNVTGKIIFGMAQQNSVSNPMTPKTGTGDLIKITMQVVGVNQSTDFEIDSANSMLVDWPDAFPIDFTTTDGVVTTASCPPTDILLSNTIIAENEPVNTEVGTLTAIDPDASDTHTFSLVQTGLYPDNVFFNIAGSSLRTNAIFDFEVEDTYSIRVRATDNWGEWFEKEFTITIMDVNEAPIAVDDHYSTLVNQTLVKAAPGVLSNDTDPDGDSLTAIKVTDPDIGTAILSADGALTYIPSIDWVGITSFTYMVYDGDLYSEVATVTIQVNRYNVAPTDINLSNDTIQENKAIGTLVGTLSTVDLDIPNDSFTYQLVSGAGDDDNGSFTIAGDQLKSAVIFDYEAKNTYTIRVRSTDQGSQWVEKAFTIYIEDVNEHPIAYSQTLQTDENTPIGITLTGFDEDGDAFDFVLVSVPTDGTLLWTPPNVTYTPDDFFVGTDSFEFKVIDVHGLSSNTATITIEVLDVEHAPTDIFLSNQSIVENAGVNALIGTLTTEDLDPQDTFTYTKASGPGDDNNDDFKIWGNKLRAGRNFNYEEKRLYRIRVRSTDSTGLWVEKRFLIYIIDVNEAPVAYDQDVVTQQNVPVNITLAADDEDGDALTFFVVSQPAHGSLTGSAPNLIYTPDSRFSGTDSFTFKASDGEFDSNIATVTITVEPRTGTNYYIPLYLISFH